MAINVRDPETDALVRELALKQGVGLTDAIKGAVRNELKREVEKIPLEERIAVIQAKVAAMPSTGLEADKAFFDELSGDL
jgi:antitoxin VapB